MKIILITFLTFFIAVELSAQTNTTWNGKRCAVVLTYDDAIDAHLDNVVPALDSAKLKGTFYIIGSSSVTNARMNEWRSAAKTGHELGNHALMHPCEGGRPGREFVRPDFDLTKYTITRAVTEIRMNNVLLKAIDGKTSRTFAYPCGDMTIGGAYFYDELKNDFAGARGTTPSMMKIDSIRLDNIDSYAMINHSGEQMIELVKKATKRNSLLVFMFHGVGGGHGLNVDLNEHRKLIKYLKAHENEIWIATMVDVATFVARKK